MRLKLLTVFMLLLSVSKGDEDFYKILGVEKDADDRTIRKAFKKLAIQKHPDKNTDNPNAHADFAKINKAYEVLKDEETRKKYDQYGEKGLEDGFQGGTNYQSWQFYNENFGIYDDDVEIVTLNRADFRRLVTQSNEMWFINFYSTYCSHCHQLAPTWRKFARAMEGVLRIGAVNCAEDPGLCQSQRVNAYPSLVVYPSGEFYNGARDVDSLQEFILQRVTAEVLYLKPDNIDALTAKWEPYDTRPWIIDFCDVTDSCLTSISRRKLAAMLNSLVNVGTLSCTSREERDLCERLDAFSGVRFYPAQKVDKEHEKLLSSLDPRELMEKVLDYVNDLEEIAEADLHELLADEPRDWPTAVWFVQNKEVLKQKKDFKKLPPLLHTDVKVAYADCSKYTDVCNEILDTRKLPQMVTFKTTGGYEIDYVNKPSYHDANAFIRDSLASPLHVLDEHAYSAAQDSGELWIIDYFAPSGEFRVAFTVDEHRFRGRHLNDGGLPQRLKQSPASSRPRQVPLKKPAGKLNAGETDFSLQPAHYEPLMENVEFHTTRTEKVANWCPPCLRLISEYRQLHSMIDRSNEALAKIRIGLVDCDKHRDICNRAGVQSYPTSALHTPDKRVHRFVGHHSTSTMLEFIENALNPAVDELTPDDFKRLVEGRNSDVTWIVDFYAPWCGPCQQLAPELQRAARSLRKYDEHVHVGSVDCQAYDTFCRQQSVTFYPAVRLYPATSKQRRMQSYYDYPQNMWRNADTIERWVFGMLPSMVTSLGKDYWTTVDETADMANRLRRVVCVSTTCGTIDSPRLQFYVSAKPVPSAHPESGSLQTRTDEFEYAAYVERTPVGVKEISTCGVPNSSLPICKGANSVLNAYEPWLVEFFAPWCGHCVHFAPVYEQIAKALDGKVNVGKVDCEQWPGVCKGAQVHSYPTVRFYKGQRNGQQQDVWGLQLQTQNKDAIVQTVLEQVTGHDEL